MEPQPILKIKLEENIMFSDKRNSKDQNHFPQLLTATEVAQKLRLGTSTVYQLMQRGELPTVRIGRSVRVRLEDLHAFIEAKVEEKS